MGTHAHAALLLAPHTQISAPGPELGPEGSGRWGPPGGAAGPDPSVARRALHTAVR